MRSASAPAPLAGPPAGAGQAVRRVSPVLRIVLVGAAAVLAYVVLSALDGASASADDGPAGRRSGDGILSALLTDLDDVTSPILDAPQRAEDRAQATDNRPARAEDRSRSTDRRAQAPEDRSQRTEGRSQRTEDRARRTEDRSRPGEPAESPGQSTPPLPTIPEVRDFAREVVDAVASERPATPPADGSAPVDASPAGPPEGAGGSSPPRLIPPVVPGVTDALPAATDVLPDSGEAVPDLVGVVPVVVDVLPELVGVVPGVVAVVPDLIEVLPVVIETVPERVSNLVPDRLSGLLPVIPGVVDTLPSLVPSILPVPPPSGAPIRLLAPTGAITEAAPGPSAPPAGVAGHLTTAHPAGAAGLVAPHSSATTSTASAAGSATGGDPVPGTPPGKAPRTGAQQATGAGSGCGHPHAVTAATAATAGYRLLFTARAGNTDRTGSQPGVAAPPG